MKKRESDEYAFWERLRSKIAWTFYGWGDAVRKKFSPGKKRGRKSLASMNRGKKFFCACMLVLPLLQFFLFYVCVNINSFLLAFQRYDVEGNRVWYGLKNFRTLFEMFGSEPVFKYALKNSLIAYFFVTVLSSFFSMLFAFYIYKKASGGGFFKIMLFLPSVISSIVLVMLYMYFVDLGLPLLLEKIFKVHFSGFFSNNDTKFATVLIYTVCINFGASVLMYLSSMNSINNSIVEATRLEGASLFQEFVFITFPMIYPTFVTFFIIGISGIFTNQINLVSFLGTDRPLPQFQTFGYYMYQQTVVGAANYPRLSALGLMITLIVAPTTILVKYLLEKYGPTSEERIK